MHPLAPLPPQYRSLAARLSEPEFVHLFPHEYLITECVGGPDPQRAFKTAEVGRFHSPEGRPILGIVPVLKREGINPYGSMITIGRARNNDLCIDDLSVSKLHAWLRRHEDDGGHVHLTLADAGSRNGTYVDGVAVSGAPCPLPFGARVRVGVVQFWLADGAMLYRSLRAAPHDVSHAA